MEQFKGKWCINVTEENREYLIKHLKCGAGYYTEQTIFFNELGIGFVGKFSWNVDKNNVCCDVPYDEISFEEFKNMVELNIQPQTKLQYEIY